MTVVINGTTGITSVNGTAAAPSVTGADTDTGIVYGTNTLSLATGGTTAVTVDSSQNVGIGTSSPSEKLTIDNGASGNEFVRFDKATAFQGLVGVTQNAASGSSAAVAGDMIVRSQTRVLLDTAGTTRAIIDSSGNLLVGRTNTDFTNTGFSGLTVFPTQGICFTKNNSANLGACMYLQRLTGVGTGNYIEFSYGSGITGAISTNGSTTTYGTSSDYRLKENIAPMTGALSVIQSLKPCTYTWKADGSDGQGFIAHELQEVVPDCVTGEKDAVDAEGNPVYQGIDTSFLVATLTAAIQEQQAIIEQLRADVEALKAA